MGARNLTSLLPLLFPHRSRGTLAGVGESPPAGKQLGQLPPGFCRQIWIPWERAARAAALHHVAHGLAGLSSVAQLGGEGFMLEKHSCVTVDGMLRW